MKQILFDQKHVVISYHSLDKYLYVEWKGFATNDQYREVLSRQIDYTKKYGAAKICYDLRKMAVISTENQSYTNEVYFPEVSKAGSKFAAIILPDVNVFGKASVEAILGKKNEALFKAEVFQGENSAPAALAWLKSVN